MKKNDKLKKAMPEAVEAPAVGASESESKPSKKRRFTRKTLIKVMFVASILFIMVSLTYSWFSASNSASVNGLEISVVDPNNLTPGGITSGGELNAVAGDGTSFYMPEFKSEGTTSGNYVIYKDVPSGKYKELTDNVTAETAVVENVFYVDFSLSINGSHEIYMVNGTGVGAVDSAYSYLNSALRVAFLKKNAGGIYEPILVWVPHTNEMTAVYPNPDEPGEDADKISEATLNAAEEFNDVDYAWGQVSADNKIYLDTISGEEFYRCVVWLDGNDKSAENYAILDKDVTITLKFLPEAVSEETTGEITDPS